MPSGRLGSVGYAKLVYRDRSEWIAVKVPPIVPQELFDRVQELLQRDIGWVCQSLRLDIGRADYLRPLGGISGVQKIHALMGGFHLGPAPRDYLGQVIGEIGKLAPDVVIPLHCSGNNFIQAMREQMPDNLLVSTTGSRITFDG